MSAEASVFEQAKPELLYENTFAAAPEEWAAERERNWVMEGPGLAELVEEAGGGLRLRSEHFTEERASRGHFVFWLKKDFPADLAVEWDFRFSDKGPQGLAIIFICAQGVHGEDIFDPKLAPRTDGNFNDYIRGDINSYHLSYIAIGRGSANVRKNSGFHLVTSGKDLVTPAGPEAWHRLRLARLGAALELTVNGERAIYWEDDGKTHGPLHGGGKIGFRQQNNLYWGAYRNLRVYGLTPAGQGPERGNR